MTESKKPTWEEFVLARIAFYKARDARSKTPSVETRAAYEAAQIAAKKIRLAFYGR